MRRDAARIDAEEVEVERWYENRAEFPELLASVPPGPAMPPTVELENREVVVVPGPINKWEGAPPAKADEVAEGVDNPQAPAPSPPTYGSGRRG